MSEFIKSLVFSWICDSNIFIKDLYFSITAFLFRVIATDVSNISLCWFLILVLNSGTSIVSVLNFLRRRTVHLPLFVRWPNIYIILSSWAFPVIDCLQVIIIFPVKLVPSVLLKSSVLVNFLFNHVYVDFHSLPQRFKVLSMHWEFLYDFRNLFVINSINSKFAFVLLPVEVLASLLGDHELQLVNKVHIFQKIGIVLLNFIHPNAYVS